MGSLAVATRTARNPFSSIRVDYRPCGTQPPARLPHLAVKTHHGYALLAQRLSDEGAGLALASSLSFIPSADWPGPSRPWRSRTSWRQLPDWHQRLSVRG